MWVWSSAHHDIDTWITMTCVWHLSIRVSTIAMNASCVQMHNRPTHRSCGHCVCLLCYCHFDLIMVLQHVLLMVLHVQHVLNIFYNWTVVCMCDCIMSCTCVCGVLFPLCPSLIGYSPRIVVPFQGHVGHGYETGGPVSVETDFW